VLSASIGERGNDGSMDGDVVGTKETPFELGTKENGLYAGVGGRTGVGVIDELIFVGSALR
jgi:hypothetical protein